MSRQSGGYARGCVNQWDRLSALTLSIGVLAACGGGDGGEVTGGLAPPPLSDLMNADDVPVSGALPDFAVTDLVTSSTSGGGGAFSVNATIVNGGEASAGLPDAWFLISTDPEFGSDYHFIPVTLGSQRIGADRTLAPGESDVFTATTRFDQVDVDFALSTPGAYFARLWLNADLSARFLNPEQSVVESHAIPELDYTNNLSPVASFESLASEGCEVDVYEENDSLASATPIALDTRYEFTSCDDQIEVTVVDLAAGESYELRDHTPGDAIPRPRPWRMTIVAPDGRYLARRINKNSLVTADVTGPHYIIATHSLPVLGGALSFEVRTR